MSHLGELAYSITPSKSNPVSKIWLRHTREGGSLSAQKRDSSIKWLIMWPPAV